MKGQHEGVSKVFLKKTDDDAKDIKDLDPTIKWSGPVRWGRFLPLKRSSGRLSEVEPYKYGEQDAVDSEATQTKGPKKA